jgi:hypothetical protein
VLGQARCCAGTACAVPEVLCWGRPRRWGTTTTTPSGPPPPPPPPPRRCRLSALQRKVWSASPCVLKGASMSGPEPSGASICGAPWCGPGAGCTPRMRLELVLDNGLLGSSWTRKSLTRRLELFLDTAPRHAHPALSPSCLLLHRQIEPPALPRQARNKHFAVKPEINSVLACPARKQEANAAGIIIDASYDAS